MTWSLKVEGVKSTAQTFGDVRTLDAWSWIGFELVTSNWMRQHWVAKTNLYVFNAFSHFFIYVTMYLCSSKINDKSDISLNFNHTVKLKSVWFIYYHQSSNLLCTNLCPYYLTAIPYNSQSKQWRKTELPNTNTEPGTMGYGNSSANGPVDWIDFMYSIFQPLPC